MKIAFEVCKQNLSYNEFATKFESVQVLFERQCTKVCLQFQDDQF